MKNTMFHHIIRLFASALVLALCLGFVSCAELGVGTAPSEPSPANLRAAADEAWESRDFAKSELYYSKLLEQDDLPREARLTALRRLSASAVERGHYHKAQDALSEWGEMNPQAEDSWAWQRVKAGVLVGLGETEEARKYLAVLLIRPDLPLEARLGAGLELASLHWRQGDYAAGLEALAALYSKTEDPSSRAYLEGRLMTRLARLPGGELDGLARAVPPGDAGRFPYALVLFQDGLRRVENNPQEWPRAWQTLSRVVARADLADKSVLTARLTELEKRLGVPRVGVVLALPLSGRYARVGWKIASGAGAAQWELAQAGSPLEVVVVNSEAPDFVERIRRLPASYRILGGPLRTERFDELSRAGVTGRRAVFAFLQNLNEGQEGSEAWRFFGGPRDQVRALAGFGVERMGFTSFGIIHPQDRFGEHMSRLFAQEAVNMNAGVAKVESYPPGDHPAWGKAVREFLDVDNMGVGHGGGFKAVFLPDGLAQAELLIPHFFFYEENRLLFMGPQAWAQALRRGMDPDEKYFDITVFPSAWNPETPGAEALARSLEAAGLGSPGFWMALGWDFVRFASGLGGLEEGWTPREVNGRLASNQGDDTSLAPFRWDESGHAVQELYLLMPKKGRVVQADPAELAERIEGAAMYRKERVKVIKKNAR